MKFTRAIAVLFAFCASSSAVVGERKPRTLVGYKSEIYNFPYLCSVMYNIEMVSTCTIIQQEWVIVAVDNMNDLIATPENQRPKGVAFYYQSLLGLHVNAGNQFILTHDFQLKTEQNQEKRVKNFFVGIGPALEHSKNNVFVKNPTNFSTDGILFDVFGVTIGIGLLEIHGLTWTTYVLPAPMKTPNAKELMEKLKSVRAMFESQPNIICLVAAWKENPNSVVYHEVTYIPWEQCHDAYCSYNMASCNRFPSAWYHFCFKSLLHSDLCRIDRGAALFCSGGHAAGTVVGILTTAITCGTGNLPNVYTSISLAMNLYEAVTNSIMTAGPGPKDYPMKWS